MLKTYVVGLLVDLVTDRVFGSRGTGAEGGIRVFGDLFVGGGRSLGSGTLDGLRNVVGGVPGGEVVSDEFRS